jgi:hypothetical protein
MQVFEFYFNPKARENSIFESFVYEPENISEKRLGSLCIAGELANAFPGDKEFLNDLAKVIKEEYYSNFQRSSEAALKESLRKANEHLARLAKAEKVNWVGNLNFAALAIKESSLTPFVFNSSVPFILNYAQVGEMKILLLKRNEILDISRDLEARETEIYPLKVFENVVAGRLESEDRVIVATKDVFSALLPKPGRKKKQAEKEYSINDFLEAKNQKEINQILKAKKNELSEVSGIFIFIVPEEENSGKSGMFPFKNFHLNLPLPKLHLPKAPHSIDLPRPSLPDINPIMKEEKLQLKSKPSRKNAKIVLALLLILAVSYLISNLEQKTEITPEMIEEIKNKEAEAENFIILEEKNKAFTLLNSALEEIKRFSDSEIQENRELSDLKSSLEEKLSSLSGLKTIENPELFIEIDGNSSLMTPQRMVKAGSDFYFYNPLSPTVLNVNTESWQKETRSLEGNAKSGMTFADSAFFYSGPDALVEYSDAGAQKFTLEFKESFRFGEGQIFFSGAYFLEETEGRIIRFELSSSKSSEGENWLSQPRTAKGESMAVDGNIWVLNSENKIEKYYKGELKETISPAVFPSIENATKISTSAAAPYLFLLEPDQNRLIVLDKKGGIFKQYASEKFNDLLDLSISEDGKTAFLLNENKVYKLNIE